MRRGRHGQSEPGASSLFSRRKYRDDPEGFRALLPGSADVSPGPHPTDIHCPASDLSGDEPAYHREQLAAALRGLRGK